LPDYTVHRPHLAPHDIVENWVLNWVYPEILTFFMNIPIHPLQQTSNLNDNFLLIFQSTKKSYFNLEIEMMKGKKELFNKLKGGSKKRNRVSEGKKITI
jgi:hypothetical protein